MLRVIAQFFSGVAAIGFVTSLGEHVAALMGCQGPLGSRAMWLNVGLFVVCVPTVFASNFRVSGAPQRDRWSATFRGCSRWMRYLVYLTFACALVNFAFVIPNLTSGSGTGRGSLRATGVFLVVWMAFYSAANYRDQRIDE